MENNMVGNVLNFCTLEGSIGVKKSVLEVTPMKMAPEEEFNAGRFPRCLVHLSVPFSLA